MRRLITLASLCLFAFTFPALADTNDKIRRLLNEAALEYQVLDSGACRMVIEFTDGRSQLIFVTPMEAIEGHELMEIYSPVMKVNFPIEEKLARRLLTATGNQKIGYFGVEDVEMGSAEAERQQSTVFAYHNLPIKGVTGDSLLMVLQTVAEFADEMEKEQLGASSDDY